MISKVTLANAAGEDIVLHEVASTARRVATSIEGLQGIGVLRASKRVRPSAHGSLNETSWEEGRQPQFVLEVSGTSMENAWEEFRAVTRVCLETLDSGAALLKWTEGTAGNKLQMLVKLDSMVEPIILGGVGTLLSFPVSFFGADPRAYTQTSKTEVGASITGTESEQEFVVGSATYKALAIDSAHIYFAGNACIGRAALAGGTVEPEWVKTGGGTPTSIAVNGSNVFWTSSLGIGRCTLAGGTIEKEWKPIASITSAAATLECLAIDAGHIYYGWLKGKGWIGRCTLAGGSIEPTWMTTVTGSGVPAVAVDSEHIYFVVGANAIGRATIAAAEQNNAFITGGSNVRGIAVSATLIYWTNESANTIGRAKLAGTEVNQTFLSGQLAPYALAVNATNLFWRNTTSGYVGRSVLAGGPAGSTVTIAQAGNRPTPLTFKINGPITNPAVVRKSDGSRIALTGTIATGNYVEVNVANRTVKLNGLTNALSMLNAANTNWQAFSPLASTEYFLTATSATAATLEATYRSAYA